MIDWSTEDMQISYVFKKNKKKETDDFVELLYWNYRQNLYDPKPILIGLLLAWLKENYWMIIQKDQDNE